MADVCNQQYIVEMMVCDLQGKVLKDIVASALLSLELFTLGETSHVKQLYGVTHVEKN